MRRANSVLHIIKTPAVEYDDRLRKEALLMASSGAQVSILALENAGRQHRDAVDFGGIRVETIQLICRRIFSHKKFLVLKALEMYLRFACLIMRHPRGTVWVHDFGMLGLVGFLALLKRMGWFECLVWDQHELPPEEWLKGGFKKCFLRLACGECDLVIAANAARKDYILESIGYDFKKKFRVIQNFPDAAKVEAPKRLLPAHVAEWLDGSRYVVNEGLARVDRKIREILEAIRDQDTYRLVILGPLLIDEAEVVEIVGARWREKIFVAGFVTQEEIYPILDNAEASLIFYDMSDPNRAYCAPNRLYHATCRGIPIIVGSNPSLRTHVNESGNGLMIEGDGSDPRQIAEALEQMAKNYEAFKTAAENGRSGSDFETQASIILSALHPIEGAVVETA